MSSLSDTLLQVAGGAASTITKDRERQQEFMRKKKAKISESRLVRQEKEHDSKKIMSDFVSQYGKGRKGQFMYALKQFGNDTEKANQAVKTGLFAGVLSGVKDPGEFTPYDMAIDDTEYKRMYGNDSISNMLVGQLKNLSTRREPQRDITRKSALGEYAINEAKADELYREDPVLATTPSQATEQVDGVPATTAPVTPEQATTGLTETPTATGDEDFFQVAPDLDFNAASMKNVGGVPMMVAQDKNTNTFYDTHGKQVSGEVTEIAEKEEFEVTGAEDRIINGVRGTYFRTKGGRWLSGNGTAIDVKGTVQTPEDPATYDKPQTMIVTADNTPKLLSFDKQTLQWTDGTSTYGTDEVELPEAERSLGAPTPMVVKGEDKLRPVMMSWDSANGVYVSGKRVLTTEQVEKAPAAEEAAFIELNNLSKVSDPTPDESARLNWLTAKASPWRFTTVRQPDGSSVLETFRVDPTTNTRVPISANEKAPAAVIEGSSKASRQEAINYIEKVFIPLSGDEVLTAGYRSLGDGNLKQGFLGAVSGRSKEYLQAGVVTNSDTALRMALEDFKPAFLYEEPWSVMGVSAGEIGGGWAYSADAGMKILSSPIRTDVDAPILSATTPNEATTNAFSKQTAKQSKQAELDMLLKLQRKQQLK